MVQGALLGLQLTPNTRLGIPGADPCEPSSDAQVLRSPGPQLDGSFSLGRGDSNACELGSLLQWSPGSSVVSAPRCGKCGNEQAAESTVLSALSLFGILRTLGHVRGSTWVLLSPLGYFRKSWLSSTVSTLGHADLFSGVGSEPRGKASTSLGLAPAALPLGPHNLSVWAFMGAESRKCAVACLHVPPWFPGLWPSSSCSDARALTLHPPWCSRQMAGFVASRAFKVQLHGRYWVFPFHCLHHVWF